MGMLRPFPPPVQPMIQLLAVCDVRQMHALVIVGGKAVLSLLLILTLQDSVWVFVTGGMY